MIPKINTNSIKVGAKLTLNNNYLIQSHGFDCYVSRSGELLSIFELNDQWVYLEHVEVINTYFDNLPSKLEVREGAKKTSVSFY